MISEKEYKKQLEDIERMLEEPFEPEIISENPVIQDFYERFYFGNLSDKGYLKLEKEIVRYMKRKGTKADEEALKEFMESLVMVCDAIKEK